MARNLRGELGRISPVDNNHPSNLYVDLPGTGSCQGRTCRDKKQLRRQKSLSLVNPVLEEILKKIDSLEIKLGNSNGSLPNTNTNNNSNNATNGNAGSPTSAKESIISKPMQVGTGNLMVIGENVACRKERQYRQIGDKNVMINVNIGSNKCQILEEGKVVQVDTEGEIWLEIKRRSLTEHSEDGASQASAIPPSPNTSQENLNDLSRDGSAKYVKIARVAEPPRKPVQHDDRFPRKYDNHSCGDTNETDGADPESIYDQIIRHPGGRLSVKIPIPTENEDSSESTEHYLNRFLEEDDVQKYLSAGGESFELNVCKWSYEKEKVYSKPPRCEPSPAGLYSQVDAPPTENAPPPPIIARPKVDRKWLKKAMDKKMAHEYLKDKKDGAFLVRLATQEDRQHKYTIEFVDNSTIRRLKILKSEDGFHFEYSENKMFGSLDDLIKKIQTGGLEIREDSGQWKKIKVFPV